MIKIFAPKINIHEWKSKRDGYLCNNIRMHSWIIAFSLRNKSHVFSIVENETEEILRIEDDRKWNVLIFLSCVLVTFRSYLYRDFRAEQTVEICISI